MTHEEFVDVHVNDLREKLPALLAEHPGAVAFLRVLGRRADAIVRAAALLSVEAEVYAKQRLADLVLEFGEGIRPV